MKVTLVGMGAGGATLTLEARCALETSGLLIGAPRLLSALGSDFEKSDQQRIAAIETEAVLAALRSSECAEACVLLSGDSGFYSAARILRPRLLEEGFDVQVLPGLSSVSLLAARLGRPWQDWTLVSAHGVEADVLSAVMKGRPTFVLTDPHSTPQSLCSQLIEAGLGTLKVIVGENLGQQDEKITEGSANDLSFQGFSTLSVLLIEPVPVMPHRSSGWPDDYFIRGTVPMTKQPVRAMALGMLQVEPDDVCWDIGAGTGSVSVEMAALASRVYAVEMESDAIELIRANREKFCAWNLKIIEGRAPQAIAELPRPDKVFIGGTKGELRLIVEAALAFPGEIRLCISALTLETLGTAVELMHSLGLSTEVHQISACSSKAVGSSTMMIAANPVYLIGGVRP